MPLQNPEGIREEYRKWNAALLDAQREAETFIERLKRIHPPGTTEDFLVQTQNLQELFTQQLSVINQVLEAVEKARKLLIPASRLESTDLRVFAAYAHARQHVEQFKRAFDLLKINSIQHITRWA